MRRALLGPVLLALALRLVAILATDRVVADVERYERVAAHVLDVSWNPYETKRLYPYPPPWAAVEAAAEWLARRGTGSFPVNVKLPVLAADLLLVALLAAAAGAGRASPLAPWLYAAHPVSLLVGGVHGQFDAIPLFFLLLATEALARGRRDASALALAAAIASKSFPVLALPFLAFGTRESWRSAARYAALALAPGALLLLPFAVADLGALRRELFAYGGIADFGWTGVLRGAEWLATGALPRSEARFWPVSSFLSKALFLAAWAGLVVAVRSGRLRLGPERAILATLLAFSTLYGLLSAQYLLWAVPFGLLWTGGPADSSSPGQMPANSSSRGTSIGRVPGIRQDRGALSLPAGDAGSALRSTPRRRPRGSSASISSSPPAPCSPHPSKQRRPSWPGACGSAARPRRSRHPASGSPRWCARVGTGACGPPRTRAIARRSRPRADAAPRAAPRAAAAHPARGGGRAFVGRPRFACCAVKVSYSRTPPGFSARTSAGTSGRWR